MERTQASLVLLAVNGLAVGACSATPAATQPAYVNQPTQYAYPPASAQKQAGPGEPATKKTIDNGRPDLVGPAKACCKGLNQCKGLGQCKTERHGCKGQNDCKALGGCSPPGC